MPRLKFLIYAAITVLCASGLLLTAQSAHAIEKVENISGVNIYIFWGEGCPHCAKAMPFLKSLDEKSNNIDLHDYEVYYNTNNQRLFQEVCKKLNVNNSGVPLIIIGDEVFVGYSESYSGEIMARAETCVNKGSCPDTVADIVGVSKPQSTAIATDHNSDVVVSGESSQPNIEKPEETNNKIIELPLIGEMHVRDFSLPIITIIIAALDGFNPCAMWTLLFLISLLLGMNNRRRMWLLGGTFIIASAFVYLMFMTAWLNIFLFIGYVTWVKILIGTIAIGAGGYYLYDFYKNKDGTCKITGNEKRQAVFEKIRHITHNKSLWIALVGIAALAFAVNLVELVCSAGLPAIYTGILSTSGLATWQYYAYISLYVFVFMLDDLFVFFVAMCTLEMVGIHTKYARISHLAGGILMIVLGLLLIFAPQLLMFG